MCTKLSKMTHFMFLSEQLFASAFFPIIFEIFLFYSAAYRKSYIKLR